MSKQRPDPDKMANELAGASAFFRGQPPAAEHVAPVSPAPSAQPPALTPESMTKSDVLTPPRHDVTTSQWEAPAGFDITRETASRDSLRLAIDETKALDALRQSLKWDYDLSVSKNDICRVALHALLEDFASRGERSQAVSRLKKKSASR